MRRMLFASLLALCANAQVVGAEEPPASPTPTPPTASVPAPPTAAPRDIAGSVVDATTREPVAGATVSIPGTKLSTITDANGLFLLKGAPGVELAVTIQRSGFTSVEQAIPAEINSARVLLQADAAADKSRTLRGKVTDQQTGEPVPGAIVTVGGTEQTAMTDGDGSFVIENAPPSAVKLEISGDSYANTTLSVGVGVEQVDASLAVEASEQILVTGRAPQIVRQNLANGSSRVEGDDLNRVSSQTVDDGLAGKVAGANIQRNSGAPGGGVQVSLRGVSTINGQSSPLYVIDGVIVSNAAIPSGMSAITASSRGSNASSTQDNQVNRIADINPNDIENIEILKGAAAAALYGSKAANGVIIITTKRGKRGDKARVSITQRFGFAQLLNTLGSRKFETVEEVQEVYGDTGVAMFEPGKSYDHERELFGQTNLSTETIASVSGGLKDSSYFGSFLVKDEPGILTGTGYQKQSARVGFTQDFGKKFTLGVSTQVVHSEASRGMTQNDNANVSHYMVLPATPSFANLNRGTDGLFPRNPFIPGANTNPLQTVALMKDNEEVWRTIAALNGSFRPIEKDGYGLSFNATLGVDWFQQENDIFAPPELHFEPADGAPGTSIDGNAENRNMNMNVASAFRLTPVGARWKSVSTLGAILEERKLDTLYVTARNLNAGLENVDAGTQLNVTERRLMVRERGAYLQEEFLLLDDNLSLVGALLAEQSSANGNETDVFLYPKASAAYKLPKTDDTLETFRLRASYGQAGNQPLYGQKFTALSATGSVEGMPGLTVGGVLGDPNIEPERQREVEVGVDMVAFDDRAIFELTGYQKNISNLIIERPLATSTGFQTEFFNGGAMRSQGVEAMLQLKPVVSKKFTWTSRTIFTVNDSRITDLEENQPPEGGFGTSYGAFQLEEGESATQIVGNRGLKPDGTCCEVIKLGDTEPDFRMSFSNNFAMGGFGFTSLVDWQQGGDVINLTRALYDGAQNTADFEQNGMARLEQWKTDAGVYIEDATFLKLREISLYYDLPQSLVKQIGPMSSARVSLSGRNLLVLTNYSGLDPEVSNFGNLPIGRNIDVAPYAPSRSYWFSLTADF